MTLTTILLLLLTITMEIAREVIFKLAADKSESAGEGGSYLLRLFTTPRIWIGFATWGIQIIAWIMVLARMPLSIAFPLMSLCYCGTIIASKYILKEQVARPKWIGMVLITAGVALIGTQGVG